MKKALQTSLIISFLMLSLATHLTAEETPELIQKQGEACLQLILQNDPAARSYYSENAGVYLDDSFFMNADKFIPMIRELQLSSDISNRKSLAYIPHNETKGMEVGYLIDKRDQKIILYATGWSLQENEWKKDFEFLKPLKQPVTTDDQFEIARKRWVTLCNQKDPAELTKEMYLDNAIYFSYGELTEGPAKIARRYSYMSRPDYTLDLRAEITAVFDESRGMEVGKYINAHNEGVYIILWKKVDNSWKVMLDFNF